MPNPLYNVPGLGGYLGQEEFNTQQQGQGLENAVRFQTLQEHLRNQALDQAYRSEMSQLPENQRTLENLSRIGAKYAPPKDIFHYATQYQAQKETAAARLQQSYQIAQQNYMLNRDKLTDARQRAAYDQSYRSYLTRLRAEAARYNLGTVIPDFEPPAGSPTPGQPTGGPQSQWTEPTSTQVPPQDRAAYEAVLANAKAGIPSSELGVGGGPEPQPPGGPPPEPQSMDENQREMYLLQQRAPAPQGAPVARGIAPQGAPAEAVSELEPIPDYLQQLAAGPLPAATSSLPPMPAEIAAAPRKRQDDWKVEMAKQQASLPNPSAIRRMAYERLYFGREPAGWGQMGQPTRTAVRNEWDRIATQLGLSESESAMLPFDNKIKGQAILALTKWGATAARSADKLERDLEVAMSYAQRIPLAQIQFINKGIVAGLKEFNSPEANAYASAINSVRLEYARLLSGPTSNAMLPVEAMRTANELVSRGVSVAALKEVGRQMRMDANNTIRATASQIDSMRSSITNVGQTPTFREAPIGPGAVPAPAGEDSRNVRLPSGKMKRFPTPAAAAAFRKEAGL